MTNNAEQTRTYESWQAVFSDARPLPFTAFSTGYIYGALKNNAQAESFPAHRDPDLRYKYAVMVFHFRHPEHGDILVDSGFDRSFHDNPPRANLSPTMRLYNRLMHVDYTQEEGGIDLASQLERHQIVPAHVFLTHLHADHTGGLPALPDDCAVHYGAGERTLISRLLCANHLRTKPNPNAIDMSFGRPMAPFARVIDVFGDGTFWAISTPGHTPDHLAYLINTSPAPVLILGDAELTTWAMEDEILVSTVDGEPGRQAVQRSAEMLREFHSQFPEAQIWFSHDEEHL